MNWTTKAAAIDWHIEPFVDGRYRPSTATEFFDNINPSNEVTLCRAGVGSAADVDAAVGAARQRFEDGCWSELSLGQRATVLLRLADLLLEHKAAIAILDTLEVGKPIRAAMQDAERCAHTLRCWARLADQLLGTSAPLTAGTLLFNVFEPRGVIGAITPWNFPQHNAVVKLAPALMAGNTVVLKPSELSPSSALKIAELALQAGLPEGVLNVVPGLGTTVGTALALHPGVDLISFTGSTATGRKIMELCGRSNGKPLILECGGKSPQVVFDDADDLDRVADATVQGFTRNQGQVCSAHTRLIVHEQIKESLLDKVVTRASQYHPGDPLDESTNFGPLASPAQRDRVKRYVHEGVRAGARAVLKGKIQDTGGCYVSPTIFDRVSPAMSIAREEIFGPVLCVQSFKTEEEAIALANGTDYGLMATVWTRNLGRAKRLAHAIKAGHISVRTGAEEGSDGGGFMSFEPRKSSGFGVELGLKGLESYSALKSISFSGA